MHPTISQSGGRWVVTLGEFIKSCATKEQAEALVAALEV